MKKKHVIGGVVAAAAIAAYVASRRQKPVHPGTAYRIPSGWRGAWAETYRAILRAGWQRDEIDEPGTTEALTTTELYLRLGHDEYRLLVRLLGSRFEPIGFMHGNGDEIKGDWPAEISRVNPSPIDAATALEDLLAA